MIKGTKVDPGRKEYKDRRANQIKEQTLNI